MKSRINLRKPKTYAIVLIGILIFLQFFQTTRNEGEAFGENDISHTVPFPYEVKNILVASCYDCHSNATNHMWYENIQPLGWWISNHILVGKRGLNFSEFNTYSDKRKYHKLEEIAEMVSDDLMPMSSYIFAHSNAKLSDKQKKTILDWANMAQVKFASEHPELEKKLK